MVEINEQEAKTIIQLLNRTPITGFQEANVLLSLVQKLSEVKQQTTEMK